jgi:transcriptional regulator with XRE-family HTH domain
MKKSGLYIVRIRVPSQRNRTLVELGQRIRKLRKLRGWTQMDMAVNLDVGRTHLSDIEHGERDLGVITLQIIAKGLNKKISDLLHGL